MLLRRGFWSGLVFWMILSGVGAVHAQERFPTIGGPARVIDGDTIAFGQQRIRFYGIDAPESSQICDVGDRAWRCGAAARDMLAQEIQGQPVTCVVHNTDLYGRLVAVCFNATGEDLNQFMVRQGLAIVYPSYSPRYEPDQKLAQSRRFGVWGGPFERPDAYRRDEAAGMAAAPTAAAIHASPASFMTDTQEPNALSQLSGVGSLATDRVPQDTSRATFKGMACVIFGKACRHP